MVIEIDMEPLAATGQRLFASNVNEPSTYSPPPRSFSDRSVLDESVDKAVPDDIDEADESETSAMKRPRRASHAPMPYPDPLRGVLLKFRSGQYERPMTFSDGRPPHSGAEGEGDLRASVF